LERGRQTVKLAGARLGNVVGWHEGDANRRLLVRQDGPFVGAFPKRRAGGSLTRNDVRRCGQAAVGGLT
jgi:hypothetical protein